MILYFCHLYGYDIKMARTTMSKIFIDSVGNSIVAELDLTLVVLVVSEFKGSMPLSTVGSNLLLVMVTFGRYGFG